LVAYFIEFTQNIPDSAFDNYEIVEQSDTTVDVINGSSSGSQMTTQKQQVPARLVEITFESSLYSGSLFSTEYRAYGLMVLDGTMGYVITYEEPADSSSSGRIPTAAKVCALKCTPISNIESYSIDRI
jgi:hypothetical protein